MSSHTQCPELLSPALPSVILMSKGVIGFIQYRRVVGSFSHRISNDTVRAKVSAF